MGLFITGLFIGAVIGMGGMCLIQINRDEEDYE